MMKLFSSPFWFTKPWTHTIFCFSFTFWILSRQKAVNVALKHNLPVLLHCPLEAVVIRLQREQKESRHRGDLLKCFECYCFLKGADIYSKWNVIVDVAAAVSFSVSVGYYLYRPGTNTSFRQSTEKGFTHLLCVSRENLRPPLLTVVVFLKSWLHILPSFLSYLNGGPGPLGACTPIYVNPPIHTSAALRSTSIT